MTRAAVSGTSSPMDASFGHSVPNFRAASATLAGSPEAPNPRIRQANTGVHHGAMVLSLHHEVPPTPGGEEAEGGSGTWQQVVRRAQAAMMEDDEPSSPLQALAEAGSIGSLVHPPTLLFIVSFIAINIRIMSCMVQTARFTLIVLTSTHVGLSTHDVSPRTAL